MEIYSADTANELWLKMAEALLDPMQVVSRGTGSNGSIEQLHACLSLTDPTQRWITVRHPGINPAFALAEVVWILSGRNDSGFLNYWNKKLPKFAGRGRTYYGAYGHRLQTATGINQINQAFLALKNCKDSRQIVLQIWNAATDLPMKDGQPKSKDIPCNINSLLKVSNNHLEWMQIIRSNDIFLGVPHNIVQWTFLHELFSGWLGLRLGSYNQISDSLHMYERDRKCVENSVELEKNICTKTQIQNTDHYQFTKDDSDQYFRILSDYVDDIITSKHSKIILDTSRFNDTPQAIKNIALVLAADALRRERCFKDAGTLMSICSNPEFRLMWKNWVIRTQKQNEIQAVLLPSDELFWS